MHCFTAVFIIIRSTKVYMPLSSGWNVVDEKLADLFGLNESKYQWAVDEYYYQKQMVSTHSTAQVLLALKETVKYLSTNKIPSVLWSA